MLKDEQFINKTCQRECFFLICTRTFIIITHFPIITIINGQLTINSLSCNDLTSLVVVGWWCSSSGCCHAETKDEEQLCLLVEGWTEWINIQELKMTLEKRFTQLTGWKYFKDPLRNNSLCCELIDVVYWELRESLNNRHVLGLCTISDCQMRGAKYIQQFPVLLII